MNKIKKNQNQIKNDKKWLVGLAIVLILFGLFIYKDIQRTTRIKTTQKEKQVQYLGEDGKTVFELLTKKHDVDYSKSELGVFVVAIDGLKSSENEFWIYYVDDKMGTIAADEYQTKNNQNIVWKYQEFK